MYCTQCGHKKILLFTSYVCDYCNPPKDNKINSSFPRNDKEGYVLCQTCGKRAERRTWSNAKAFCPKGHYWDIHFINGDKMETDDKNCWIFDGIKWTIKI